MDLDDLLTRAAPPTTPFSADLDAELRALTRAARPQARRRRSAVLAGGVGAVLLGTGLAAATGAVPLPGGWLTTSEGSRCHLEFFPVVPRTVSPSDNPFTPEQQQAVADAANAWLASFDLDSVDKEEALAQWQAVEAVARAAQPPEERQPKLDGENLETQAIYYAVGQRMSAYLEAQGLDPDAVDTGMGWRCE
jgi:hypothetical protein